MEADNRKFLGTPIDSKLVSSAIECHLLCNQNNGNCKSFNVLQRWINGEEMFECQTFNYSGNIKENNTLFKMKINSKYYILSVQQQTVKSCMEWKNRGFHENGVYLIEVDNESTRVYCDMVSYGGGWIVISRDIGSDESTFHKSWKEYKQGFGDISNLFWIGNEWLHKVTTSKNVEVLVIAQGSSGLKGHSICKNFRIESEENNYGLSKDIALVEGYQSFDLIAGKPFSTKDKDNEGYIDRNCAYNRKAGWWYSPFDSACGMIFLNGPYKKWPKGKTGDLKKTYVMIRFIE